MTVENPAPPPPVAIKGPHPVKLTIEHQEEYSRGLAVLGVIFLIGRAIALIPVLIVLYVLNIILGVGGWIVQFAVLFTGHYPEGAHVFFTGIIRLQARMSAFLYGLTDRYPGFSLSE